MSDIKRMSQLPTTHVLSSWSNWRSSPSWCSASAWRLRDRPRHSADDGDDQTTGVVASEADNETLLWRCKVYRRWCGCRYEAGWQPTMARWARLTPRTCAPKAGCRAGSSAGWGARGWQLYDTGWLVVRPCARKPDRQIIYGGMADCIRAPGRKDDALLRAHRHQVGEACRNRALIQLQEDLSWAVALRLSGCSLTFAGVLVGAGTGRQHDVRQWGSPAWCNEYSGDAALDEPVAASYRRRLSIPWSRPFGHT